MKGMCNKDRHERRRRRRRSIQTNPNSPFSARRSVCRSQWESPCSQPIAALPFFLCSYGTISLWVCLMCKFHKLTVDWANCCSMWVQSCKCACDCDVHSCGGGLFMISASSEGKLPPACSPSSYFSLSFFSPTVSSLSFSPSPYLLPFFTFQLICPFPWTLSASSTPSFIPVLVGVVGPPPFPFSFSFLPFFTFESFPLFSLSRSPPRSIWQPNGQAEKEGGGDGGRVCHFSSFSVICLCLSVGLRFFSPALICSL